MQEEGHILDPGPSKYFMRLFHQLGLAWGGSKNVRLQEGGWGDLEDTKILSHTETYTSWEIVQGKHDLNTSK